MENTAKCVHGGCAILPPCLRDTPIADRMVCLADHKDCWQKRKDALLKALAAKARLQIHIPED